MKGSDRTILLVLPLIALVVGFYLLAISPKQKQIGDLDGQIGELNARIAGAEDEVAAAESARKSFPRNYAKVVAMGSAVPEDSDQATLIYDLTKVSDDSNVRFRSFELSEDTGAEAAAPPATTTTTDTTTSESSSGSSAPGMGESTTTSATTTAPVIATEVAAAALPIGAAVGSAGLPVMPYKLRFSGSFFDMADFFANLDDMVDVVDSGGDPEVRGRLMTINGFAMVGDPVHGFPLVQASMSLNTYVVPAGQGLSDGATPAGPAPVDGTATAVATGESSSTVPSAAAVAP